MRKAAVIGTIALASVVAVSTSTRYANQLEGDLLERAAVSLDEARANALARVPSGRFTEAEIEEEAGRLIYSFELEVDGRRGSTEVEVDAMTGEVLLAELEDGDDDGADDDDDGASER